MYKLLLFSLFLLLSCNETTIVSTQPTVLGENSKFNLEKTDFNEDISKLFSKKPFYLYDLEIDTTATNFLKDSVFKYNIQSYIAEAFKINLPSKDLGYLYKTREIDSLAVFNKQNINKLSVLTNTLQKPIAYYAESEFSTKKEMDFFILKLRAKYGKPEHTFLLSNSYDNSSYEWVLKDRTIQIETSKGKRFTVSTNEEAKQEEYYRLEILIINNAFKEPIYKAHILELPEKFNIRGVVDTTIVYHNLKELRLEKQSIVEDEFLLNSYNEELIKNE